MHGGSSTTNADIIICAPFTSLETVGKKLAGTPVKLGAQNMYFESAGAYTGEISAGMLKSCGCEYVILGHSERRQFFGETNVIVNKKVLKALDEGLKPILCIGENLQEHEDKLTESVIEEQLTACLQHVSEEGMTNVVIAYEPIWAIGTGKTATSQQAQDMHAVIRKHLAAKYGQAVADSISILYGGSVNAANAKELFSCPDVDGGLVGGASLKSREFTDIIKGF